MFFPLRLKIKVLSHIISDTAEGMAETIGNVSSKAKDVVADTTRGLVNTAVAEKTTAEYAGKAAGVMKDAALDVGWNTAKVAGDTAVSMAETIENMSSQAKDIVTEQTTGLIDTAVDVGEKEASYVGETAVAGKDFTLETGKTTAQYAGKAAGALKDTAVSAAKLAGDTATGVTETCWNLDWGDDSFNGGACCKKFDRKRGGVKTDNSSSAKVRGESGGNKVDTRIAGGTNKENSGQQGTGGAMSKGGSGHQVSGGKVVGGGHEYQGGTGASVVRVTRETVEIKKDTKDTKQRHGG
nr:hypothetical protein [Tanacetum cinerariifolium]